VGSPHVIGVITCDVWRVPCVPCTEVFSRGICAAAGAPDLPAVVLTGRGLHASSCQLNVSTVGGIRGTEWGCQVGFRACVGVLSEYQGVPWGIRGCLGCFLCEKRLRLSSEVDECKSLLTGGFDVGPSGFAGRANADRNHAIPVVGVVSEAGAYTRPLLSST
jgi:hypothetical protein